MQGNPYDAHQNAIFSMSMGTSERMIVKHYNKYLVERDGWRYDGGSTLAAD